MPESVENTDSVIRKPSFPESLKYLSADTYVKRLEMSIRVYHVYDGVQCGGRARMCLRTVG